MNVLELSEQEIIRRNSLNEMRAMGIDPYPAAEYVTNAFSTDIKAEFKEDETEPRKVSCRCINENSRFTTDEEGRKYRRRGNSTLLFAFAVL